MRRNIETRRCGSRRRRRPTLLMVWASLIGALGLACAATSPIPGLHLDWQPELDLNRRLPAGIRVYAGFDANIPLRAWYVKIDEADEGIQTRVVVSSDADRLETVSAFARRLSARVVVNGGLFRTDQEAARHVGLLLVNGELLQAPTPSLIHEDTRYYVARAAIGFVGDGSLDIGWISSHQGLLYEWLEPPANRRRAPIGPPDFVQLEPGSLRPWSASDALGAGPGLVVAGQIRLTATEEGFFGASGTEPHPRTAAGHTNAGELILLVVDGRQLGSRGVNLHELATLMRDLGCVEALNLDGGGSTTLVVDGTTVNWPAGSDSEREVMSALAVFDR